MKVGEASNEVRKDVLETEAQQKLLRGIMKSEYDRRQQELKEGSTPEESE
jgi:hypothetical protein